LNKAADYIRPPLSRQDAPFPRFVLAAAGSGRSGEMNTPRFCTLSGLGDDLFEHSA